MTQINDDSLDNGLLTQELKYNAKHVIQHIEKYTEPIMTCITGLATPNKQRQPGPRSADSRNKSTTRNILLSDI